MQERDIPGVGEFSLTESCGAAWASNQALAKIGPDIQWVHSCLAGEKTFCVYLAKSDLTRSDEEIRKHADLSGIPVAQITEIPHTTDPLKASN